MKHQNLGRLLFLVAGLLVSSCATPNPIQPALPPEVALNPGVSHVAPILIKVRLETGEMLTLYMDTGSPVTVLDKSLESKLGKRIGTKRIRYAWGGNARAGVYAPPALYWGDTRLKTGSTILTDDISWLTQLKADGIIGMDCLRHYCMQIDFAGERIRFPGA